MSWIDPLPLPDTPFARLVEASLRSLKFGTVASYRAIAEKIGCPQGARAVGNACGSNRFPLIVPCHRVITSTGQLGGFSQSLLVKKRLLEFETQRDW
jgi:methylated-DNA-[protein]-cysteine S-methyltransferase